ncbi:NADH dehydrogenase [ubiquinone] 1 alpha subcomplex subunit 2, partial [Mucuna pruriens]
RQRYETLRAELRTLQQTSRQSWREAMAWRGHLSKNIKELRFLMCQSSPASSSARAFVERNYKELKTLNPKLPILIRECSGVEPQLWARYDLGVEKGIKLEGLSEAQIFKALEDLPDFFLLCLMASGLSLSLSASYISSNSWGNGIVDN